MRSRPLPEQTPLPLNLPLGVPGFESLHALQARPFSARSGFLVVDAVLGEFPALGTMKGSRDGLAGEVFGHARGSLPGGVILRASSTVRFPPFRCETTASSAAITIFHDLFTDTDACVSRRSSRVYQPRSSRISSSETSARFTPTLPAIVQSPPAISAAP